MPLLPQAPQRRPRRPVPRLSPRPGRARPSHAPAPPGRRVCTACRESVRVELLAEQRRSPGVRTGTTAGPAPAAFLPGGHGYELATYRDREDDEAERARRVEVYREQVARTGRIDYDAVPPAPVAPRIVPRRDAGGMIRLDAA
jgi:hypothetical protein